MRTALVATLCLLSNVALAGLTGPTVQGPASSTLLGIALWNSTDGTVLQDSSFLYDGTSVGGGLTATFKPTVSGTSKVYGAPNLAGNFVVNNANDTLNTTFMGEALTWFNNSDTSKRMKFSLSGEATGKTVTINVTSPLAATAGTTGIINFPPFGSNEDVITLLKSLQPTLSQPYFANYMKIEDYCANIPILGGFYVAGVLLFDACDGFDFYTSNGKLRHVDHELRTEVDFGSTPLTEKAFTITDGQSTAISANNGTEDVIDVHVARTTTTGKTYVDESDMDSFFVSCTPGTGNITCMVRCLTGQFRGTLALDYKIVSQVVVN